MLCSRTILFSARRDSSSVSRVEISCWRFIFTIVLSLSASSIENNQIPQNANKLYCWDRIKHDAKATAIDECFELALQTPFSKAKIGQVKMIFFNGSSE